MSFFKPTDFSRHSGSWVSWGEEAASMANKVLEAHLATLPRVYGSEDYNWSTETKEIVDTQTALLWGITEIEKKQCEHVNVGHVYPTKTHWETQCLDCGANLKAKWEKV